jgi:outer membrane phospholipase A
MESHFPRPAIAGPAQWLLLIVVLFLTTAAGVPAEDVTCVFAPPPGPLPAGSRSSLWVYCMNNSTNEVQRTFEPRLPCTLTSQSVSTETVIFLSTNSVGTTATIAPGGFAKAEYLLDLPAINDSIVTLAVSNYNPIVILVAQDATRLPASTSPPPPTPEATQAAPESIFAGYFGRHISFYEPIYFILGSYPAAEFQLSLKYRLLDLEDKWNPFTHFYFAYTQTSFWDLISKNPSFYDTSYKPSLFFYYPALLHKKFFQLDLQLGIEHESNGQGGSLERSLNTGYFQPKLTFDLPGHVEFSLQPRAWFYAYVGDNNENIAAYRGYGDLLAAVTWTSPRTGEKIQVSSKLRIGDEGTHAGAQFDLRFNLANVPVLYKFNPTIQVQYFTGYGQTLRQYDQISQAIRGGVCLWY